MKWTVEFSSSLSIVKIVTGGIFTVDDHLKMVEDIISQPFWKPGMDTLFDHRNLEFVKTDIQIMKAVSENHKKFEKQIGGGKAAILMKSLTDFARGRQFELLTGSSVSAKLNIFMDERKALEWLSA